MAGKKSNISKVDRLKELEKLAEKLGIGQNRKVKCVACKKNVFFRNTIVLTDKKKVTYICKKCYRKLENGELDNKQIGDDEILKEIEKIRKLPKLPKQLPNVQPVPYIPTEPIPWTTPEPIKWVPPYTTTDKYYCSMCFLDNKILKLEGYNANKEDGTT